MFFVFLNKKKLIQFLCSKKYVILFIFLNDIILNTTLSFSIINVTYFYLSQCNILNMRKSDVIFELDLLRKNIKKQSIS